MAMVKHTQIKIKSLTLTENHPLYNLPVDHNFVQIFADANALGKVKVDPKKITPNSSYYEDICAFNCLCTGKLKGGTFNKEKDCSHCLKPIYKKQRGYFCENGKISLHRDGFYLCWECGSEIKERKNKYQRAVRKMNSNPVKYQRASRWLWLLIGGTYDPKKQKDAKSKKDFDTTRNKNFGFVQEFIDSRGSDQKLIKDGIMFEPNVLTKDNILTGIKWLISTCCKRSKKRMYGAVIYYSGHGKEKRGDWALRKGKVTFEDIPSIIIKSRVQMQQLNMVFIIDCCYAGVWCHKLAAMYDVYPSTKKIVMLASGNKDDVSKSNVNGSFFTRYLLGKDEVLKQRIAQKKSATPYYCVYVSKSTIHKAQKVSLHFGDVNAEDMK